MRGLARKHGVLPEALPALELGGALGKASEDHGHDQIRNNHAGGENVEFIGQFSTRQRSHPLPVAQ